MPNKKIVVSEQSEPQRLDVFLSAKLGITRSQIQRMIESDLVFVNKKLPKKTGEQIKLNDKIEILSEKKVEKQKEIVQPLKIIETTKDYIVVDKPSGMLTHPTQKNEQNSVSSILLKSYPEIALVGEDKMRPGIVHRLDKEASGLLVVARNQKMFEHLKNQFKNRQIDKEYLALAHDEIQKDHEVIDFGIKRSADKNRMSAVPKSQTENGAKTAITEFDVEKRFKNFTLLRVKIHTGRSHQIRAHMLAYDHPITGDKIYFQKKRKYQKDKECERLFLHCTKLVFADLNNEHKKYSSPLPSELCAFLEKIK